MRPLLLTLDAFNTLFHPRHPIPVQYAASASTFNIPISPSALQLAFKSAFKAQSRSHPNYGRELAVRGEYGGPKQWWEDVIRGSFARALAENSSPSSDNKIAGLPDALVADLLHRFAGARGYKLYDDVGPFFERLHEMQRQNGKRRKVVIGVVSNSDDRVCSVLESLGVSVGEARAGEEAGHKLPGFEEERERTGTSHPRRASPLQGRDQTDVDFVLTSYQVGAEKPDPLVWDAALQAAQRLGDDAVGDEGGWECVHVGDDYRKDYRGAVDAGWKAYYLPRDVEAATNAPEGTRTITSLLDLFTELRAFN
ncbi:HAD-like domain-containing protein [Aspergillus granulosus]|uniref:HAD-like domain-containing protein n=1 Tax=Aspergillus granulosus TaxID=176169 RepID=A0ABR4H567_9EURO